MFGDKLRFIAVILLHLWISLDVSDAVGRPEMFVADYRRSRIVRAVANVTFDFVGAVFEPLPLTGLVTPMSVQFDQRTRKIYWTDISNDAIYRAKLDGTEQEVLVGDDLQTPEGLVIDIDHDVMYWTDSGKDRVESANLDGSNRTVLVDTGSDKPRGITVSRIYDFIFWADWGSDAKIERANIDGSNRTSIVTTELTWPNSVALSLDETILYWCDAHRDVVEGSDLHGNTRVTYVTTGSGVNIHPFDIAIYLDRGDIYFTDFNYDLIIALDNSISEFHLIGRNAFDNPAGIVFNQNRSFNFDSPCGESCVNGICVAIDNDTAECQCLPGFVNSSTCLTEIDECASSPCHFGTCIDLINAYECHCNTSHSGLNCEEEVDECLPNPCQHGGTCSDGIYDYTCVCTQNFLGTSCEIPIDYCYDSPCMNGDCSNGDGEYICTCDPGYNGNDCDSDIDECVSSPCLSGGSCMNAVDMFECQCPQGFYGKRCEVDLSGCVSSPCYVTAICVALVGGEHRCHCPPGTTGQLCDDDINECAPNPCFNGGTCQNMDATYQCSCMDGFLGVNCETDLSGCVDTPCNAPGGLCYPLLDGGYRCGCYPGYKGERCEIDINECESNPCTNGGSCRDGNSTYACSCKEGFTGVNCEIDIDECASSPCGEKGLCRDLTNSYSCTCMSGYTGTYCQVKTTCARPLTSPEGTQIVGQTFTYFYGEVMTITCTGSTNSVIWLCLGNNKWQQPELACQQQLLTKTSEGKTVVVLTILFAFTTIVLLVMCFINYRRSGSFKVPKKQKGNPTVTMSGDQVQIQDQAVVNPTYVDMNPNEFRMDNGNHGNGMAPPLPDKGALEVDFDAAYVSTNDDIPLAPADFSDA